eukprot:TRINITY_DN14672_c0_g1_i2.p1 TRINITY_DN14672_c0_g1~~TRINITY_DN14672_c0_g1_i2.p1  ORF type:complete len:249 (-),score=41.21 TRINITY_DN14672_c0_g1_i2:41-787(-)
MFLCPRLEVRGSTCRKSCLVLSREVRVAPFRAEEFSKEGRASEDSALVQAGAIPVVERAPRSSDVSIQNSPRGADMRMQHSLHAPESAGINIHQALSPSCHSYSPEVRVYNPTKQLRRWSDDRSESEETSADLDSDYSSSQSSSQCSAQAHACLQACNSAVKPRSGYTGFGEYLQGDDAFDGSSIWGEAEAYDLFEPFNVDADPFFNVEGWWGMVPCPPVNPPALVCLKGTIWEQLLARSSSSRRLSL